MTHPKQPIKGFHKLTINERRQMLTERLGIAESQWPLCLDHGGLDPITADKVVENVLGTYALPFGVAPNFLINGKERCVPMVVEEPSVIAAASHAAKLVKKCGGFHARTLDDWMTVQIEVHEVHDELSAQRRLTAATDSLLDAAREQVPGLVQRGGGPRALEVRCLGHGFVVVHLHVDCQDAMGANLVNTIAEGIGPRVAELAGGTMGLRILTNLCDRRRVSVECRLTPSVLVKQRHLDAPLDPAAAESQGLTIARAIEQASRFAELDPYRATTHNKGIMNGLDSVVLATGNDYRAVEAGAHAYAARSGTYRPLAIWRIEEDALCGRLELPLALGIVGGTLRVHPTAKLALELLSISSAQELAQVAAATGLASNLSALRALATEGIQKGHMALHHRGMATLAGARGEEVEEVARELSRIGRANVAVAAALLAQLRASRGAQ